MRIWAKGAVIGNSARKMRRYMKRFSWLLKYLTIYLQNRDMIRTRGSTHPTSNNFVLPSLSINSIRGKSTPNPISSAYSWCSFQRKLKAYLGIWGWAATILVQEPRTHFRRPPFGIEATKQGSQVANNAKGVISWEIDVTERYSRETRTVLVMVGECR